jgi:hypothetical protein
MGILKLLRMLRRIPKIERKVEDIMATQAETIAKLEVINNTLVKVRAEVAGAVAKVDELQAIIERGDVPQPIVDLVDGIAANLEQVDILIPDAPVV